MDYSKVLAAIALLAASPFAAARQPPAALDNQVRELVRQLGAQEFAKRQAARKTLLGLGEKIVPILDRLEAPPDLEAALRLRKIRYELIGYAEEIEKYLGAMPPNLAERPPAELAPELKSVIASSMPKSGEVLLRYILDPKHPLQRRAAHALASCIDSLTASQIDAFLRHSLILEWRARTRFPRGADARIGMLYYYRYDSNDWPGLDGFKPKMMVTQYLDGKAYPKAPFVHQSSMNNHWWILSPSSLAEGKHIYYFTLDYEFTHQGDAIRRRLRSPDHAFEILPPSTPDELIATADPEVDKLVRQGLRFLDREPVPQELAVGRGRMPDPWIPQVTSKQGDKELALRVPTWKVEKPLPVDLCFRAEIIEVLTGKVYKASAHTLLKGKTGSGHVCPEDVWAFAKDRTGFVDVQVRLTSSRSQALSEADVTRYYPGAITSDVLRMKIIGP